MWIALRRLLPGFMAVGLLWACGSKEPPGETAVQPVSPKKPVNLPAQAALRNTVAAVALNKTTQLPVQLRFQVLERPDVGQPVDVDLLIVPSNGTVDRISGQVQVDDGLELVAGAQIPPTDRPAEGVPITHSIKVLPKHDGIFTFKAILTVDSGGQTATQTYSMPLIAGSGITSLPVPAAGAGKPAPAAPAPSTAAAH